LRYTFPSHGTAFGEGNEHHHEEILNMSSKLDTIRQIKSRRMWWAGYVIHMGEMRNAHRILPQKSEGKGTFGPGNILTFVLKMLGMRILTGVITVRIGSTDRQPSVSVAERLSESQ
jgi:hypothetical protein